MANKGVFARSILEMVDQQLIDFVPFFFVFPDTDKQ